MALTLPDPPPVAAPSLLRRVGRFRVSSEIVNTSPEQVMAVLAEFLVVRCEFDYASRIFNYTAISHYFDAVPEYCEAPLYELLLTSSNVGTDDEPRILVSLLTVRRVDT